MARDPAQTLFGEKTGPGVATTEQPATTAARAQFPNRRQADQANTGQDAEQPAPEPADSREAQRANTLFGDRTAPAQSQQPSEGGDGPDDGGEAVSDGENATDDGLRNTAEDGERLYDGGEAVTKSIALTQLDQVFGDALRNARYEGDEGTVDAIEERRSTLASLAESYEVGQPDLQQLTEVGKQYSEPAGEDALSNMVSRTAETMRERYGEDAPKVLDAAFEVIEEAAQKDAGLVSWLSNGAQADERVLSVAIRIARKKGKL